MMHRMNGKLVAFRGAAVLACALAVAPALAADTPVADAAMAGDAGTVRALIAGGADVNAAQGDGMTALHWAAFHDDLELGPGVDRREGRCRAVDAHRAHPTAFDGGDQRQRRDD